MTGGGSSIVEVQRLAMMIVASKIDGRIAEIGTAFGDGAQAIVSALTPGSTFVTVEPDPARFGLAEQALAGTRAEVINARWQDCLPAKAPFDVIFFDGGTVAEIAEHVEGVIGLLAPGEVLIKDDLTPGVPVETDPLRAALLSDSRVIAVELQVTSDMAVILASRRP